jgi:hypothetical protein
MEKLKSKNKILLFLTVIALILISVSVFLYSKEQPLLWQTELAKAMMGLAMTAIIGGFIKFLFDQNQKREEEIKENKEKEEEIKAKQKEKEDETKRKQNEFRNETLNRLRKIFDDVDGARLLIEAHKSAKTYGDKMRDAIIPSVVALYDIKRSLADSINMMDSEKIRQLRLNMHYMIAYLQALANEYKNEYCEISNIQFYEEEWKKQLRDKFIKQLFDEHKQTVFPNNFFAGIDIHKPPMQAWEKIEQLPLMGKFIVDDYASLYRKLFVDFYEYSKRILKEQETKQLPEKFNAKYFTDLDTIDLKRSRGELTINDSLVNLIIKDLIIGKERVKGEITKAGTANHIH